MKAQISRPSHRPEEHYSGVYQQQGRMITDADWNELMDIVKARQALASSVTLGNGVPGERGVLEINDTRSAPGVVDVDVSLQWGKLVVDGIVAEVLPANGATADFDYTLQRQFPQPPALPAGNATFYADVWERLIVSIQDSGLRDPALHGADTCVRTQLMAQIKYAEDPGHIADTVRNPRRGNASFGLTRAINTTDAGDPCLAPTAIARALGNYLFRLEVHHVERDVDGNPVSVTLKWSSENGAEAHSVDDAPAEFRYGDWNYEFFNDVTEQHLGVHLHNEPVKESLLRTDAQYPASTPADGDGVAYPYVRRWDGYCIIAQSGGNWSLVEGKHLGQDVSVDPDTSMTAAGELTVRMGELDMVLACGGKSFVAGDYWLALLRQANSSGDQPRVLSEEPVGIVHHYLKLITTDSSLVALPGQLSPEDVRQLSFPPLSDMTAERIGYDPTLTTESRWNDINESSANLPHTVQDAIDQLAANVEASDIVFDMPACAGLTQTVQGLLSTLSGWPDLDGDGNSDATIKDVLYGLLCNLDSERIPYSTALSATLKQMVDEKVIRAGDTMTGDLAVMAKLGVGVDRIGSAVPGGKLHISGGSAPQSFANVNAALEVDHPGDNNSVLQANGANGPFRLNIQDGHGRVSQTWNAYDSASVHKYDGDSEGAVWLRFRDGDFSVKTAPGGSAHADIPWNLGFYQAEDGQVAIGKESPNSKLDVDGTVEMTGFKLTTGPQVGGHVLTYDAATGEGKWQVPSQEGWEVDGTNVYADIGGSQNVNVGIGTANPESRLQVSGSLTVGNAFTPAVGSASNIINLLTGSNTNGTQNGIGFYESSSGFGMKLGYDGSGSGDRNALVVYDVNSDPAISFESGGNIAIEDNTHRSGKIRLWQESTKTDSYVSHAIGTEAYHNTYGAGSSYTNSIGHKFYRGGGELIARIGHGGSGMPGNRLDSYFAGGVDIDGNLRVKIGNNYRTLGGNPTRYVHHRFFFADDGTSTAEVDLGTSRRFTAFVSIIGMDPRADFDRGDAFAVDVYTVDGTMTSWKFQGGDHFGSPGSSTNVRSPYYTGTGRRIVFRARSFQNASVLAMGLVFYE